MRSATLVALLALWAVGCGDDGGEDPPGLVGAWLVPPDEPGGCAYVVSFEPDGTYAEATACELTDGSIGVEAYAGTYTSTDGEVTIHQTHGTCDAEPNTVNLVYTVNGDTLQIGSGSVAKVLERAPDKDTPGQAVYGCYAEDGTFTPQAIAEL
jgi:hypothetical protein